MWKVISEEENITHVYIVLDTLYVTLNYTYTHIYYFIRKSI